MRLRDKRALVTGAGSGIGRSIAIEFAREEAKVAVNDANYDLAKGVAEEVKSLGGAGLPLRADVAVRREVNDMVERIVKEWGGVDILVNNAGTFNLRRSKK